MKKNILFMIVGFLVPGLCFATLPLNKPIPQVSLEGDSGGRLDEKAWSSTELMGKVHVIFYVDPDAADVNNAASEALKAENFSTEHYQSVAIINLAATWLPNFAIQPKLESKQKQYPSTLYLVDKNKSLVSQWGLQDDSSNILVVNKSGIVVFSVDGALTKEQITLMVKTIYDNL